MNRGNAHVFHVTSKMNLFDEEKSTGYKRENLCIHVVLATHTLMFKSESERVRKLESLRVGVVLKFTHMKL